MSRLTYPGVHAIARGATRPKWPFGINWQSPQARGLTCWLAPVPFLAPGGAGAEVHLWDFVHAHSFRSSATASTHPQWVRTSMGLALSFDGVDDVVSSKIAGPSGTDSPLSNYITASTGVMACWVRPATPFNATANVFDLEALIADTGGFAGIHFGTRTGDSGDRVYFYNWDGNSDFVSTLVTSGVDIHVAWRHAGGTLYGYVNGLEIGNTASGDTSNLTGAVRIARNTTTVYLECLVSDVRFYNFDVGPQAIYQMWHPLTRHELYKPLHDVFVVDAERQPFPNRGFIPGKTPGPRVPWR